LGNDNTATITGTNDWARATDGSNNTATATGNKHGFVRCDLTLGT